MTDNRQGKITVLAGFLLLFSVMGIACNCFSLTIVPITGYFGFSRASYALAQTLLFVFSSVFTISSSKIYKRIDIVKAVKAAVIIEVATFFLQSYATKVWMFYISNSILGFCMGMCTALPVSLLINEWISIDANTFIGMAMMGSGLGGAVFNPMMNWLITGWGWQNAFRAMALVMGALSVPAALLMKRNPEALRSELPQSKQVTAVKKIPFLQKRLVLIAAFLAVTNCFPAALNFAINPQVQDLGYSASFASMCSSVENAVMGVGKITVGRILDKKGVRTTLYLARVSCAISMVALAFFRSPLVIFMVLINLGLFFGCPLGTVAGVAITTEAVGKEQMPAFVGTFSFALSLGATIAPMLLGSAYDLFGSYSPMLLAMAALEIAAIPFIALIFRIPLKTE